MPRMLTIIVCIQVAYTHVINNVRLLRNSNFNVITEDELRAISEMQGTPYLNISAATPAFPVEGVVLANRYMINLLVRKKSVTENPYRNVMFMIDTSSPYTFLSNSTMGAMIDTEEKIPDYLNIEIQGKLSMICYLSDVNLLGMDFMRKYDTQIITNWAQNTFTLHDSPPPPPFTADFIVIQPQVRLQCNCSRQRT